jgi:hypothetical protein
VFRRIEIDKGGVVMIKVKTFASPMKVFHVHEELESLDTQLNRFLEERGIKSVISVSDTSTSDDSGATIGLIRVLTYEEP